MTTAPNAVTALFRAAIGGDSDGIDAATKRLDGDGWAGSVRHVFAVFGQAVQRRFPPGYTRADIVHFVADVRAASHDPGSMSADIAEELVRVALGEADLDPELGFEEVITPQISLAVAILREERLSDAELDEFFTDVELQVEGWLAADREA
ncbi:hypothetical protein [Phytomonospora endophytica]|uniref:Uncharacterized protein n=1 Tax=Phytomonospora endophytica TaxID=714109 RepID=A0A841F6Y4_9ACTN|nr:hypothetical protein [Phytomonospora endophytica]MBB6032741.1 hypothetical protein [Phytomonospora endophytica]GIG66110.1 hypothetical protein Pen01_24050 [Phytomonospora endophytica]